MTSLYAATVAVLLLCARVTPAFAACANAQCTDSTAIDQLRATLQATCGCTRDGQTHGKYAKCVKSTLRGTNLTALGPAKACRKLIMQCENASTCGKPDAAVCCVLKGSGKVKASIVGNAAKCKKGTACGTSLGLFSRFDACAADGTCAGPLTTTTTAPSGATVTSSTTTLPSGGGTILKGALTATPGRFNYNLKLGLAGADAACNTRFSGTHACTHAELQSAQTAGDLAGLKDTANMTVTSFWAIDSSLPALEQCQDDITGGSQLNWEYGTAHTASRGRHVDLNNAAGTLGALSPAEQCNFSNRWVGCCQ